MREILEEKDIKSFKEKIERFLKLEGYEFTEDKTQKDKFFFLYRIKINKTKITIFIGVDKEKPHRLEFVNITNFSKEHIKKLKKIKKSRFDFFIDDMMIIIGRLETDLVLVTNPEEESYPADVEVVPHYILFSPIYIEELSLSRFLSNFKTIHKAAVIARRLVQIHLGRVQK